MMIMMMVIMMPMTTMVMLLMMMWLPFTLVSECRFGYIHARLQAQQTRTLIWVFFWRGGSLWALDGIDLHTETRASIHVQDQEQCLSNFLSK